MEFYNSPPKNNEPLNKNNGTSNWAIFNAHAQSCPVGKYFIIPEQANMHIYNVRDYASKCGKKYGMKFRVEVLKVNSPCVANVHRES